MRQDILKSLPKGAKVLNGYDTLKSLPEGVKINDVSKPENTNPYFSDFKKELAVDKIDSIINNIPELPGDSESKKKLYKDLLLKGITTEESKQALETLSGTHPHQEGGVKYYINDRGVPVPLKNSERPPVGYEVASIWGSKSDASDDNPLTDLAKTVWNVLPSAAENVVDLVQTGYEGITGESSDNLNSLKNAANYLKFEKDPDIQKSMLNTDGIDEYTDVFEGNRWDFSPNTLWGTALGLAGSVGEMYVGGKGLGTALKTAGVSNKIASTVATYAGSFMANLGDARESAEAAGLEGRDKALFSALVTAPIAAIDAKFDLGGKILSNKLMQEEKSAFIKRIAQDVGKRFADGELTKEALDGLAKATTVGYSQLAKKWSKETTKDILEQGGEEAAQAFMLNAGEQLWDKLTDEEKKKFGTDAFDPKSFAEYLREGLAGAIGGAPTAFAFNKVKERARKEAQDKTAYGIATRGDGAISAFKQNVANEVKAGKLSEQEAKDAILQVDSYALYDQQTKGLELNEDEKRQVFNLTFQKQNLEQGIPSKYEEEKLNGIEQAQIEAKRKQAKLLQDDINKIIFKEQVGSTTEKVNDATKEEIAKGKGIKVTSVEGNDVLNEEDYANFVDTGVVDENILADIADKVVNNKSLTPQETDIFNNKVTEVEDIIKTGFTETGYKLHKDIRKEKRSYDEIEKGEWNKKTTSYPMKLFKLGQKLLGSPKQTEYGTIETDYQDKDIDTFRIKLPDGKTVRFASSMKRKPTKEAKGGYRGHTYEENFDDRETPIGAKVGVKAHKLPSGRVVVSIFNAEKGSKYGKHLGFVKERLFGNSEYDEADQKELGKIQDSNQEFEEEEIKETPKTGINIELGYTPKQPKVVNYPQNREGLLQKAIDDEVQKLKDEGNYDPSLQKIYEQKITEIFDKFNPELLQKKSFIKGDITKIVEKLQKSMPKMKVVYDENLKAAGKVKGDTITINPYYAGLDTPIHEYGHVFIDSIGYNNKVIQSAIKQLKGTKLWDEIAGRYPLTETYTEEMLAKEVLAEAIGREGAGVFEKVADRTKFKAFLDYIFDWIKTKLGLNKNIAKSLAKQVIGGVKTEDMVGSEVEQLQKTKEERKQIRKEETSRLEGLLGVEDINDFKAVKNAIDNMSMEDLILTYNEVVGFESTVKNKAFNNVKREIAYRTFTKRKEEIKKQHPDKFIEEMANKTDLKPKDVLMKALSHMTESFPELQEFSKMFDSAFFDMTAERYTLKNKLEKLGKKVIEEKNKQLGIVDRAKNLFSSDNAKYFDFVEKDGRYLTMEEGKAKGLSEAQLNFLEFMHELNDKRNEQLESMGGEAIDDVLKVDKGWKEALKTEGLLQAFSAYLGNGFNLRNVRIKYIDPVTGKQEIAPYGEVEKKLYEYGNKGKVEKAKALLLMLKYNFRAKKQVEVGVNTDEKDNKNVLKLMGRSSYQINPFGALDNKFLKNRDKDRGYSKDFYKASFDFIDDYTHTKYMSQLLPYIDSIEFLNEQGIIGDDGEILHAAKPYVVKWIKDWKDLHLFKTDNQGALGPEVDAGLRALRKLTSLMVMAFNWTAGAWNIAMGVYNNIRSETEATQAIGLKRLFEGKDRKNLGLVSKKAADILEKYQVVSIDYNSNPKVDAGRMFDQLAHGITRMGEYVIQGSLFMGLMSEEDFNSFEYKENENGVEELVLKDGVDEKAFKERMINNKKRVSDIQGKYGESDRRNYMISEFGKAVAQFKVWLPDAWRQRWGDEYIDRDGNIRKGTFRGLSTKGFTQMIDFMKDKGAMALLGKGKDEMPLDAKNFIANVKGLALIGLLLSLKLGGDDDEKKRRGGDMIDKALSQLFLGFDPQSTKFTFQNPVASTGPILKLIDAVNHALHLEGAKAGKDVLKATPYNKIITQIPELIAGED